MNTPIYDFVKDYARRDFARFHIPGHKGAALLGCEYLDITEIAGADELFSAEGIILESENCASSLFGTAHSFYSTEGSTLAIKTMLSVATLSAQSRSERPRILAARNAHKAFLNGCALLDIEVDWLYPETGDHLCACPLSPKQIEHALLSFEKKPCAVYLTSPDYLGNISDIAGISRVCHAHGIPLLVDNAHGAYLKFLTPSRHPIDLGADICCDSAHKTLPCLTGGAYVHISKNAPVEYVETARNMMAVFATTSPSYLILQSLDLCNRYLSDDFPNHLKICVKNLEKVREALTKKGFCASLPEPLKLVIDANASGYEGSELVRIMREKKIEPEFADDRFIVLMATPENRKEDMERVIDIFSQLSPKAPIEATPVDICRGEPSGLSIREAIFSPSESIPTYLAEGRICGAPTVSCPPAIPIVISGEIITRKAVELFLRYGITQVRVLK